MHTKRSSAVRRCAHNLLTGLAVGLFAAALFAADPAWADDGGQIQWRTGRTVTPFRSSTQAAGDLSALAATRGAGRHLVVQFDSPVTPEQRTALDHAGLKLLSYLGDNAFFASVDAARLDQAAVATVASLRFAAAIERNWKLHPSLAAGEIHPWAVVDPGVKPAKDAEPGKSPTDGQDYPGQSADDPMVAVYVLLHPDVALSTTGLSTIHNHGGRVRSELWTVNGLVVELPASQIPGLADEDIVEYLEPPLPRMSELNDDNRTRTGANIVQAAPYGLNGSGITVLVYDGGYGLSTHQDFGGRLHVRDSSGLSDHSTHVAGTIGGSGAASSGTYKGMAPAVTLEAYGFEQAGGLQQGFLYTDPGDLQSDYNQAINTYGADISNNSIGTNTAPNGFPCDWEGNYGVTDTVIDAIVRGSLGAPFRVIWANGNERQVSTCLGIEGFPSPYHSTAPPACAKNHITVGAMNSNDDSVTSFTSFGPADDGRLKPDISAPGCQSNGDNGVTSCSSSGNTSYVAKCGTSMAAPTVCGLGALLLQDYRVQFPGQPDPRNSTLKVLFAHNAQDIQNPGPDYQTGYGSVRIQPTIDFMRSGNFLEQTVSQGDTYSVLVVVDAGAAALKVTLAWDDPPGTPNVSPALVNDLDLEVFDPSQTRRYPWTLSPTNPSANAVRTQADHLNNLEQVYVASPTPGVWRVNIHGYNVPQGPQPFSLAASPELVNCSNEGIITLDRSKYTCAATATVQVVDCQLNTDSEAVESIVVTVKSDAEPAGELVTLTETAAESAAFRGSIPLSPTNAAGALQVAHGGLVTAEYLDADDGQGGTNVLVTDTAPVDCQDPVISNVLATNIEPRDATITFTTNETAAGVVHYGTSCAALTATAPGAGLNTSHSIALTGLTDQTTYYYAVDATDEAGNTATADNGGGCFFFSTPDIPNLFTELFANGDNDLDNLSLIFTPNGSNDFYRACAEPITSLPTDPTGGTALTFSPTNDDGYATVTLSGGQTVPLYGVNYGTFYPASNGYITFTSGESSREESFSVHFNQPRISALFDDLDPGSGGTVSWKQLSDRVAVTWLNVREFNQTNSNTCQIVMYFDGRIEINYLAVAITDGLAGLSAGGGVSSDFYETDLSAGGACGPKPPIAANGTASTGMGAPVTITLSASDDGLPDPPAALTYAITSLPAHKLHDAGNNHLIVAGDLPYTLVGGGRQVIYTPGYGYNGSDGFQFKANDGGTPPDGGDSNVAAVSITIGGRMRALSFPLDSDPGWATQGLWAYGVPTGAGTHNHDPSAGHTGTSVYGYNLSGDYASGMLTTSYLTTAALDCTALSGVELRFWRWLGVESAAYDHATLEISGNGVNWTTVWSNASGVAVSDASWVQVSYDLSAAADDQPTVYLRWGMGPTDTSITYPGWNIDDVEIWAYPAPPPLPGDFDHDGDVDSADFDHWGDCMTGPYQGPAATGCDPFDFDGDTDVDLDDFAAFQMAFEEP